MKETQLNIKKLTITNSSSRSSNENGVDGRQKGTFKRVSEITNLDDDDSSLPSL